MLIRKYKEEILEIYQKTIVAVFIVLCFFILSCSKENANNNYIQILDQWNSVIEQAIPESEMVGEYDLVANTNAKFGGKINIASGNYPKTMNYWKDVNSENNEFTSLMFTPLYGLDSVENLPRFILAQSVETIEKNKSFLVKLRSNARWSDGREITAQDVLFYYETIMNPSNLTPIHRHRLKIFEKPIVINSHTLQINAKEIKWDNFWTVGGFMAFPKHIWGKKEVNFNDIDFSFPVTSGPYSLLRVKENSSITFLRKKNWWGRYLRQFKGIYNFDQIQYKFINDRNKQMEILKKGEVDFLPIYTSSIWIEQTDFDSIKQNWIIKKKIVNEEPIGIQGLAFNLRKEKFQDIRVRKALSLLINRTKINEKLMYNQYFLLNSYFPNLYSGKINSKINTLDYDPDLARTLLKQSGWKVVDGKLQKNNKVFSITFYLFNEAIRRHLDIYVEDLKSVGINVAIEQVTLPSWKSKLDNREFDLFWISWSSSRLIDPDDLWHSEKSLENGTQNITSYSNYFVDQLIESIRFKNDFSARKKALLEIDNILFNDFPYVLLWNGNFHRLLWWNKFDTPDLLLGKYGDHSHVIAYWSYNENKDKALQKAKKENKALSPFVQ